MNAAMRASAHSHIRGIAILPKLHRFEKIN